MKIEKTIKLLFGGLILGVLLISLGSPKVMGAPKKSSAPAKGSVAAPAAPNAEEPAASAEPEGKKPASKKVLRFDTLTITGEAAKPQVFYLLNRKKILVRHEPEK